MATRGRESTQAPSMCTVCGGILNDSLECTLCGTKHDPNGRMITAARELPVAEVIERFTRISGVGESKARMLYEMGYTSLESLQGASAADLAKISGIGERLARTIKESVPKILAELQPTASRPPEGDQSALQSWLSGAGEQGLNTWLGGPAPAAANPASDEALKRWLTGEEDALGQWLGEAPMAAATVTVAPAVEVDGRTKEKLKLLDDRERELRDKEGEIEGLRAELEAMKRTMNQELADFKTGSFDPMKYVEETARLSKEVQAEVMKRRQLEQEVEHIKKGSIAVVKYVKSQQMKADASPAVKKKLAEETEARIKVESQLKRTSEVLTRVQAQVEAGLAKMKPDERVLKQRELTLVEKEATLKAKEEELAALDVSARGESAGANEELRSRMQEELREKEEEFLSREEDLKKRIIELEESVGRFKIEDDMRKEAQALSGKSKAEIDTMLSAKEQAILSREKSLKIREQEIQRLKEEAEFMKDEMDKLKQQVAYKDEELLRREEDLLYREKILQAERRKVEEAKAQGFGTEEKDLRDRLEQLKAEINTKEEEVRSKEKYLKAKMEELRLREQGLIEEEIEARDEERKLEVKQEKIHTGTPRLDDLLLGGIPFGSQVFVYGPAYVGKEVIVNAFLGEGLKKGVPAIFVITDKTPNDIREEMAFVLPGFEEYERLGLVKYVDAYSRSMGSADTDQYTVYVNDPTDHDAILKTVDEVAKEYKKKHEYYRLCFRSISTLIAYLDPTTTFRFLQPFSGRRKRDKAVALYLLEKGMHGEQEIQMLGSVMDGSVEIKVEQLKSFLCVKGICDVQSRAWIRYTYSKSSVNIGSFSLDHIR